MGMRPIRQAAGRRPTAPTIGRGSERKVPHIGTETRSKLLREAAVRNIGHSVREDGPTGCKPLFRGDKVRHVWRFAGTA